MASQTTALTIYSYSGDKVQYSISGHTAVKPKLVLMSRKVPTGNQSVTEISFTVLNGTEDADGNVLPSKVAFTATCRMPLNGDTADRDAALATFRDIVAGDEFANSVSSLEFLNGAVA